jgi:hypothetical protein
MIDRIEASEGQLGGYNAPPEAATAANPSKPPGQIPVFPQFFAEAWALRSSSVIAGLPFFLRRLV